MYKKKKKGTIKTTDSVYLPLQVEAIFNALTNNPAFFERKVRRWYSKNFNTPLQDTFSLPWDEILIHYYESTLEDRSFNELYDIAIDNYLPEFVNRREEEAAAFAESLVKEQQETLKKKQAQSKGRAKKAQKTKTEANNKAPEMNLEEMSLSFNDDDFKGDKN
jgi:hypothetical protein